jgi:hypothetical protein
VNVRGYLAVQEHSTRILTRLLARAVVGRARFD